MNKINVKPRQNRSMISVRIQKQRLERFRAVLKRNKHAMTDVVEALIDMYLKENS